MDEYEFRFKFLEEANKSVSLHPHGTDIVEKARNYYAFVAGVPYAYIANKIENPKKKSKPSARKKGK